MCTVGNFHRFSDIGDIVPQKWVKWTHRWIKCAENWFQIFLASGLYDHVAFGLETFVTLMKIGMLSRREKIFLHAKIQQIRSRNGWDTAQLMFLPWPFIYWLCKAVEADPRKSPKKAFHQYIIWPNQGCLGTCHYLASFGSMENWMWVFYLMKWQYVASIKANLRPSSIVGSNFFNE